MYIENPEGIWVILGSMKMGYDLVYLTLYNYTRTRLKTSQPFSSQERQIH